MARRYIVIVNAFVSIVCIGYRSYIQLYIAEVSHDTNRALSLTAWSSISKRTKLSYCKCRPTNIISKYNTAFCVFCYWVDWPRLIRSRPRPITSLRHVTWIASHRSSSVNTSISSVHVLVEHQCDQCVQLHWHRQIAQLFGFCRCLHFLTSSQSSLVLNSWWDGKLKYGIHIYASKTFFIVSN